jgi:hypothetical protein
MSEKYRRPHNHERVQAVERMHERTETWSESRCLGFLACLLLLGAGFI